MHTMHVPILVNINNFQCANLFFRKFMTNIFKKSCTIIWNLAVCFMLINFNLQIYNKMLKNAKKKRFNINYLRLICNGKCTNTHTNTYTLKQHSFLINHGIYFDGFPFHGISIVPGLLCFHWPHDNLSISSTFKWI